MIDAFALASKPCDAFSAWDSTRTDHCGNAALPGNDRRNGHRRRKNPLRRLAGVFYGLRGRSVHVATPNAYLAGRDCELLTPVYRLLNCSIGLLRERLRGRKTGRLCLRHRLRHRLRVRLRLPARTTCRHRAFPRTLGPHYRNILRGKPRRNLDSTGGEAWRSSTRSIP